MLFFRKRLKEIRQLIEKNNIDEIKERIRNIYVDSDKMGSNLVKVIAIIHDFEEILKKVIEDLNKGDKERALKLLDILEGKLDDISKFTKRMIKEEARLEHETK